MLRFISMLMVLIGSSIYAQQLQSLLKKTEARNLAAQQSQANINMIVQGTRDLMGEYVGVTKELDGLEVYNKILEKQLANQRKEMDDLNYSITQVKVIHRQVTPLMLRMVDGLEQFIKLDLPFLLEEREKRVAFLKKLLEQSDVNVPEKFRRVLEAYSIENDYGRSIETYKGNLPIEGVSREVEFLRIGRIALLFQTIDREFSGVWDNKKKDWVPLGAEYRNEIYKGRRMAKKQIAPELLMVPVQAPEVAK
jgi:uncharacterized coiled-coil protein SlyX